MSRPELLMALSLGIPLLSAVLAAGLRQPLRLLPWAALPGLACAALVPLGSRVDLPGSLLGASLQLDAPGAVLLGLAASIWTAAGVHAQGYLRGKPHERGFCVCWLLTLAGSLGVCLAADAVSFYVAFAFVSLPAYVLVVHERSAAALRAGRVYIALAVFAETSLLLGLMIGVDAASGLPIEAVSASLPGADRGALAALGLLLGLGLKCGLVPLHGWLPLAHAAAPVPASAVLSGAIVKAGVIGLLRFVPMDGIQPDWAALLTTLGLVTAWLGVLLGLPQREPKPVLAYSTMSQMGLLVAVLGTGAGRPGMGAATVAAALLFAVAHGLAKAALFLGVSLLAGPGRRWVLAALALLGLSLAGLPLTGGALAKLAAKGPLGEGVAATMATWAAGGTLLLMLRFLYLASLASRAQAQGRHHPPGSHGSRWERASFAALALAALVWPWALLHRLDAALASDALTPHAWWAAVWPLLPAAAAASLAWLRPFPAPPVPTGDVAAWLESAWRGRAVPGGEAEPGPEAPPTADRWAPAWRWAESAAVRLSAWPAAAVSLVLLGLAFGGLLG